jgi:hypothetical protein
VALLGAIPWTVVGYALNVLVPLIGVAVCCESLGRAYYSFAYWFPLAVSAVVMATVILASARDPASAMFNREKALEAAKGTIVVIGLWLTALAWTGNLRL